MKFIKIKGLFKKLLLYQSLLLIFLIGFLFLTLSIIEKNFWTDYLIKDTLKSLKLLNLDVMRAFGKGFGKIDKEGVHEEFNKILLNRQEIKALCILDGQGNILYSYGNIVDAKASIESYSTYNNDILYRQFEQKKQKLLDILMPFTSPGRTKFLIRYIIHFPAIESQMSNINAIFAITAFIALSIAFGLSYVYVKKITVPINILKDSAKAISEGKIEKDIPSFHDELGELAEALKKMVKELNKKQTELMMQNKQLENALNEVLFLQNRVLNYEKYAALGKISAGMSHEIDNPLGIILGHAELLLDELPEGDTRREEVEVIIREGQRIKKILRSLLDFAKPRESKTKEVKLSDFIKKVLENFSFQKIFRKIKLDFSAEDITVLADEDKLHQVLVNIILNAIHAMPEGGRLTVRVEKDDGMGKIVVADEGVGIPEELQNKVFDLFFSTKKDGTGLGLAISKKFIEEMNGEIFLLSEPKKGTTVFLKLPLA